MIKILFLCHGRVNGLPNVQVKVPQNWAQYGSHSATELLKPDIVFTKYKIAIFCDGEFFHGKDWEVLKPRLEKSNNSEYWISKISRNKERDDEINKKLLFLGWTVIRFWGNDIKKNTDECIRVIEETIFEIKTMDDYTEE